MRRYLIERAFNNEPLAVVAAVDEVQAFERLMSLRELLGINFAGTEYFNVLQCLPDEPIPQAPAFSAGYFELQGSPAHYTMQ